MALIDHLARLRVRLGLLVGIVVLWLATPAWPNLVAGALVASCGEGLRLWAAGHLEKGREVTRSGPYRWLRHPLYAGSALLGIGLAIAVTHLGAAALVLVYAGLTLAAAARSEQAWLRSKFGAEYERYLAGAFAVSDRRFSLQRALYNREHHTVAGVLGIVALLAWKASQTP